MEYFSKDDVLNLLNRNSITKKITLADGVSIYDSVKNLPTADVVPKSEVEKLRFNLEAVLEEIPETKREVATEIFEDIRKTCGYSVAEHNGVVLYHTKCYSIMATKLDELEMKYTESEDKE